MTPRTCLDAIRDLVAAAEEDGWDLRKDLAPVLDAGRDAYAALRIVMADADEDQAPYQAGPGGIGQ